MRTFLNDVLRTCFAWPLVCSDYVAYMLQCVLVPCLFFCFFVKVYLEKAKLKSHDILLVSKENHVHKAQSRSSICLADFTF